MKFEIDMTGLDDRAKSKLVEDIAYFEDRYGGRVGDELTDEEVDEILARPVESGTVDYGLVVVDGSTDKLCVVEFATNESVVMDQIY